MIQKIILLLSLGFVALAKTDLLFYCGITMVPAVMELKTSFEKKHDCTITIVQGGSKDLCKSIQTTKQGDLFLPGKSSYIDQCSENGEVLYKRFVGYNRLALFVPKGNPLQIKNLDDLVRRDLLTILGNPDTCSIGKAAEETLMRYSGHAFLEKVQHNLGLYAADSRDMNHLLASKQADVGLNWVASAQTQEARDAVDILPIFDLYSQPQELIIATLHFTAHAQIANAFVDYLASPQGQTVMKKHGFDHE